MKKESGFSAIEAIIIVIVVALLGLGAWFVYDRSKDSEKTDSQSQTTEESNASADDTAKMSTTLTSYKNAFSLQIPDGWKVTNDTETDYAHAIGLENMTYTPGTPAVITNALGHRGGGITISEFMIQAGSPTDLDNYYSASEYQGTLKTNAGLEGKKYLHTSEGGDETVSPKGTKSYGYLFSNGKKTTVITYQQLPGDPDQLDVVEQAIKTFQFL